MTCTIQWELELRPGKSSGCVVREGSRTVWRVSLALARKSEGGVLPGVGDRQG